MLGQPEFDRFFLAAAGFEPFEYQRRLAGGDGGRAAESLLINVPTGLGKTAAVVLAWLWNSVVLAHQAQPAAPRWPRRLVYCLPMRTLVEQTRKAVETWLTALLKSADEIGLGADSQQQLRWLVDHSPVVIMGGEDPEPVKREWDIWPEKACILIGTQDMLLSRALNRGYAMSRYRWPMHFGLLNNDCLWVMDEVQLMGPGLWTSGQLDWMRQERFGTSLPCWTWWMSATNSDGFLDTPDRGLLQPSRFPFDENEMPPQLMGAQRPLEFWAPPAMGSPKKIRGSKAHRPSVGPEDQVLSALARRVEELHQPGTLSLVVCNTVAAAQKLHQRLGPLERRGASLILLTSRLRKLDRQVRENTLIEFEKERKEGRTTGKAGLICIATQVVEAGVDVSACRLWTEVAPWPSIVQRLGRLNRDGLANGSGTITWLLCATQIASIFLSMRYFGAIQAGFSLVSSAALVWSAVRLQAASEPPRP
jgi:CRISPR-associated endonuclease/helicase Cas3